MKTGSEALDVPGSSVGPFVRTHYSTSRSNRDWNELVPRHRGQRRAVPTLSNQPDFDVLKPSGRVVGCYIGGPTRDGH